MPDRSLFTRAGRFDLSPFGINGRPVPAFQTELGALFRGDCLKVLPSIADACIDTVFADPPFNLGKKYGDKVNDQRADHDYLEWCHRWLAECVRVLKPGGSLFLYNLPKWNVQLGYHLGTLGMEFRHWIAVSIKLLLPIPRRLYPAHYSLLYYSKGKPTTFRRVRTPIETCRHPTFFPNPPRRRSAPGSVVGARLSPKTCLACR
jgi:site-specific DNA-methyltransferase (adenine-specific)